MRRSLFLIFAAQLVLYPDSAWAKRPKENSTQLVYWHGDNARKQVALTFDDGPHPEYTACILDILAQHNVKATFFLLGRNVERYPDLARRIAAEGHVIGNHGYSHHELKVLSRKRIRQEIEKGYAVIHATTGESPVLFRPPFGLFNRAVISEMKEAGQQLIHWSLSPKDWARPRESVLVRRVVKRVRNGSIILLHDSHPFKESGRRDRTVNALPLLIESLREKGFEFATVSDIIKAQPTALASSERMGEEKTFPHQVIFQ